MPLSRGNWTPDKHGASDKGCFLEPCTKLPGVCVPVQFGLPPSTVSLSVWPSGPSRQWRSIHWQRTQQHPASSCLGDAVMADPLFRGGGTARLRLGRWGSHRLWTATIGPQIAARSAGCLILILLRVWECGGGRHKDPIVSG